MGKAARLKLAQKQAIVSAILQAVGAQIGKFPNLGQSKIFEVVYWHNDNSYGQRGDDPIEMLDAAWNLEGIDGKALLKLVREESFRSIEFGDEDLGCKLSVVERLEGE